MADDTKPLWLRDDENAHSGTLSVPPPPTPVDTETTQNPAFSIKRIVPYVKEYLKAYMWLQKTNPVTIASFMKSEDIANKVREVMGKN